MAAGLTSEICITNSFWTEISADKATNITTGSSNYKSLGGQTLAKNAVWCASGLNTCEADGSTYDVCVRFWINGAYTWVGAINTLFSAKVFFASKGWDRSPGVGDPASEVPIGTFAKFKLTRSKDVGNEVKWKLDVVNY